MKEKLQIQFSRQMILHDIGELGQQKLFSSRVGIFGVGGLGTWSSLLCAQMGIGYLRLVDRDVVERSNLPRTPIFTQKSIDLPKVEEGAKFLQSLNPTLVIDTQATNIDRETIDKLLDGLDIVIDGLDTFQTRYVINKACFKKKIPYIFAGGLAMQANLSTFTFNEDVPCLNCFFGAIDDKQMPTCETSGVHTSLLAITASLQVTEAIRLLTGKKARLDRSIAYFDLNSFSLDIIPVKKNKDCNVCGLKPIDKEEISDHRIIELCGENSFMIVPKPRRIFNIDKLLEKIKNNYQIRKRGSLGLTFVFQEKILVSIFNGGNLLIRGVSSPTEAKKIFNTISSYLKY
ncbi:MAG: HesA/MoeB/ThiF family protein [Candidatus Hodarchaeales archaeon]|jgi:adenylyltransferase/sulfurtransferase